MADKGISFRRQQIIVDGSITFLRQITQPRIHNAVAVMRCIRKKGKDRGVSLIIVKNLKLKIIITAVLTGVSLSAAAVKVEVTIRNNTAKWITNVSSPYGFSPKIRPWGVERITVYTGNFSSYISANFSSGQTPGGCEFQAGHKLNSIGPLYDSSGKGYGQVLDPFCFVHVQPAWRPPYDYKVTFMISQ